MSEKQVKEREKLLIELNKERLLIGLPPIIPKKRKCLKCDKEFLSESNAVRLCYWCKN